MFGKGYRRPVDITATLDSYRYSRSIGATAHCKLIREANPELRHEFAKLDRAVLQRVVHKEAVKCRK